MREKRNAYEMVGTNKIVVDRIKVQNNAEMNDKMKDKFIHEKKEGKNVTLEFNSDGLVEEF